MAGEELAAITGRYYRKDKNNGDYLDLNRDGTFGLRQDGKDYAGKFAVRGDIITVMVSNGPTSTARLAGNRVVDSDGMVWERAAEPQKDSGAKLTLDQIIQMVAAKLPDDIIIKTIQNSGSKFDLAPEGLIKLKTAGVSDAVIRAMIP